MMNSFDTVLRSVRDFVQARPLLVGGAVVVTASALFSRYWKRRVPAGTVLELDLTSTRLVTTDMGELAQAANQQEIPYYVVVRAIKAAAIDSKVVGLVIKLRKGIYFSVVEELQAALKEFRAAGKKVIAFAESFGEFHPSFSSYMLATSCDLIFIPPSGSLTITDFCVDQPFLKGTLAKLGLESRLKQRKQYKNMANFFSEEKFTDAHREATDRMLSEYRRLLFEAVAAGRNMDMKTVEDVFQNGPYMAQAALERKLIDGIYYEDQVYDKLHEFVGRQARSDVSLLYLQAYAKKKNLSAACGQYTIAYINCYGNIHVGESTADFLGTRTSIGSDTVCRAIKAAVKDKNVKAIVLHVDSGGGSYVASDNIARQVLKAREAGKPVISSMLNVAASGGYFISHHCNKIVCTPGTITGSIGVVFGKFLTKEMWNKLGISWDSIQKSENSTLFSGLQDYTQQQNQAVDKMLDSIYDDFTGQVSKGRNLSREQVEEVAKGRVWLGHDAKERGLVDELGGLDVAVRLAKQEAKIDEKATVKLVSFPKQKTLIDMFFEKPAENSEEDIRRRGGASLTSMLYMPVYARFDTSLMAPMAQAALRSLNINVPDVPPEVASAAMHGDPAAMGQFTNSLSAQPLAMQSVIQTPL